MLTFEYIILGLTYTSLSIALFLQLICYTQKKIESLESVALTASLLLLVVSISLSPLFPDEKTMAVTTLLCMVLVAVTTFLNTLRERKHAIHQAYIKTHLSVATILAIGICATFWFNHLVYIQYLVVGFLIISILISMTLVRLTKPIKRYEHLEKASKVSAILFLILVPAYFIFHYVFKKEYQQFQFGFLLYIGFTTLAIRKIYDDLQRLSLINKIIEPQTRRFKNYGLTEREEEIALLLIKGVTYQNIAAQLFISMPTVKTHASNIYKKCGVSTRNELTYLLTN